MSVHVPRASFLSTLSLLALVTSGCPATTGPDRAARQYLEARGAGDADAAWSRLDDQSRTEAGRTALRAQSARESDAQRAHYSKRAGDLVGEPVAAWATPRGVLRMVWRGTWRVGGPLPRFDRADTPRRALTSFAQAVVTADWGQVLALAPRARRETMDEATVATNLGAAAEREWMLPALEALKAAGPGKAVGEERWVFAAGPHRAVFVREAGAWRLEDLR